jgi:hypothetical protein
MECQSAKNGRIVRLGFSDFATLIFTPHKAPILLRSPETMSALNYEEWNQNISHDILHLILNDCNFIEFK